MDKARDIIRSANVSFVLPFTGNFRYSSMLRKDKALCVTITEGYFESENLDAIVTLRIYFNKLDTMFRVIGCIDGVRVSDIRIVYRLRLSFLSFKSLLLVMRHYNISLLIKEDFRVSSKQLRNARKDISNLKAVCALSNMKLNDWLTDAIIVQLILICDYLGVTCITNRCLDDIFSIGLLYKSPYICGSISNNYLSSSVIVLPIEYFVDKSIVSLLGKTIKGYRLKVKDRDIYITGFTRKNLKFYRRRKQWNERRIKSSSESR